MRRAGAALAVAVVAWWLVRPVGAGPSSVEEGEAGEAGRSFPRAEVHGLVDARFVATGERTSWLDGGFGRTRYGGTERDRAGLGDRSRRTFHAGQVSLVVDGLAAEGLGAHLQVNLDATDDRRDLLGTVGLVEAFGHWSRVLSESARLRLRGGVSIPSFSLEHPEVAWSTRYTITPSAIGSWIGEELKSTGVEGTVTLTLGSNELDLQGAVFGGNDGTGALLAWRGWALHDRQGQTDDELPLPAVLSLTDERFFPNQGTRTRPFKEIDGRPGWHALATLRVSDHGRILGGWYDSNGDVTAVIPGAYTWDTHFGVVGGELRAGRFTVLAQYLDGRAEMGFETPKLVRDPFRAGYVLGSVEAGGARLTARWDRFEVGDEDPWREGKDLNDDDGWAATVAWIQRFGDHHRLETEYLHVDLDHPFASTAGEPGSWTQEQFQAGWRVTF